MAKGLLELAMLVAVEVVSVVDSLLSAAVVLVLAAVVSVALLLWAVG